MNIEDFINSRMDVIFAGLLQNNAEYALTYRRYEHLCELTDPVVCQRKDIEISGEECESFALGVQRAIWFFGAETPQSGYYTSFMPPRRGAAGWAIIPFTLRVHGIIFTSHLPFRHMLAGGSGVVTCQ